MTDYSFLGVIGSFVALINGFYYFWTIIKGHTKPHRITWFGWSLIGALGTWSAFDGGAGSGGYVVATESLIVFAVFLFSLLPGKGKPGGHRLDYIISIFAIITIIAWRIMHFSPAISLSLALISDSWFSWLTLRDCWKYPETESVSSWFIAIISTALGVAALQTFDYAAAGFPLYMLLTNCLLVTVLLARRVQTQAHPHNEHPPIL